MFSQPAKSVVKNVGRRNYRKTSQAVVLDTKRPHIPVTSPPEMVEQNAEKPISYSSPPSKQSDFPIKKGSEREKSFAVNLLDVPHKFLAAEKNNISFNRRGKNFPVVAFSPGMMGICKQGTRVRSGMTDNEPVKVLGEMGPSSYSPKSYSYSRTDLESRCLDLVEHYRATRSSMTASVPRLNIKRKMKKKRTKKLNYTPGGESRPAKKLLTQTAKIRAKRIRPATNCKSSRRFFQISSKRKTRSNIIPAVLSNRKPTLLHDFSTTIPSRINSDLSKNNACGEPVKKCEPSQGRPEDRRSLLPVLKNHHQTRQPVTHEGNEKQKKKRIGAKIVQTRKKGI